MKNNILTKMQFAIGVLLIASSLNAQLKVVQNGNVAIGINYPNHSLHVWGNSQCFNYNLKEIAFFPNVWSGSNNHCMIGSNLSDIVFYHSAWGYNSLKRGSCVANSDQRIKRNITNLNNSLSIVKQLVPKKYKYIDTILPGNKFHYGFIAQEVAGYIPDIVDSSGMFGYLTLNYEEIIPFLAGAIKEQSSTIDSLREALIRNSGGRQINPQNKELEDMKQKLEKVIEKLNYFENNCCTTINTSLPSNLTDNKYNNLNQAAIEFQNVPNPFENVTTIKFKIPEKYAGNFQIKLFKISGEELKSFKVSKQDSELIVNASDMVNGVYNYALICNSEILIMKQMIISK